MGACESCGGRDRTEVTIEPKPKRDDEISTTARGAPASTSAGTRSQSQSQASPRGATTSGPFSPRAGDGDKPAKLLRPQSSEAVKVDGSTQRPAASSVSQKRPAPQATKTKLTPLGEGDEPPSLDRALSPRGTAPSMSFGSGGGSSSTATASTSASTADRYKVSPSPNASRDEGPSASRVLKPKAAADPKRDGDVKRADTASSPFGGKKKERETTGGAVALGGSSGGSGAQSPSGSLKRVQTPATGAVATPPSPARTAFGAMGESDESGGKTAVSRAPSLAAALAAAAPAPSLSAALAAAAPTASAAPATPQSQPQSQPQQQPLHEPVKPKPLDTSSAALLTPTGSAPPTPSRAGTAIATPKAVTPDPEAEAAAARDAEANAEAARQRQQTLKAERLARERADTEAAAKAAADAAEAESARAARAEQAKRERDTKYAQIAEAKRKAAEAEAAQKKAEDEKKARIAENPSAVSMADKAALIAGALTPKAGDAANIEALVREQLSPAPGAEVNLNNCKVFARVLPEKLPAAYRALIDALCAPHNAHVTSLSMTYCGLTDEFLEILAAALPRLPPALTEIVLESNSFGGRGLTALCAALPANHTIRTFKFDNQKGGVFPPDARRALIAALEANDTVTSFGIAQSGSVEERNQMDKQIQKNRARLRAASTPKAAKVAVDNPFTQRMEAVRANADTNFSFELKDHTHRQQWIGWPAEQQSKWLSDVCATNTHVTELKLSGLQLKETVLTALYSALAGNKHIAKLDVSSNAMTEPCVRALTDCLRANTALTEVRLTECKVPLKGEALLMALAESGANTTLKALKMVWADKNAEKKVDQWLNQNKKAARDASKYATL